MGSTLIFKVRKCLKPFKPFIYQGSSAFYTLNTSLCKSPQLPLSARFLCTRHTNPTPGGRQTDRGNSRQANGQGGVKSSSNRPREVVLWDGVGNGSSKRTSPPKSVFAAGTAKRIAELMKRKASPDEEPNEKRRRGADRTPSALFKEHTGKMQHPDRPLSVADWTTLKESLGNSQCFDIQMMQALSGSELDIAKSLLTFVAMETGTLSYKLLMRYLMLCERGGHDAEVFDLYDIMQGSFPSLDTGASTLFIKSFSRTERWREAVAILRKMKKVFTPSQSNYGDTIAAAMSNGDTATAWALYDELIENGMSPNQWTLTALYKGPRKTEEVEGKEAGAVSQSEHRERLLRILVHMRNNQIYPQSDLASSIKTWFESLTGQRWTGSWTTLTPKGVCNCCGSKLESIELTAEEYQQLKNRVMADIIEGQDVFKKTSPEELERFKMFVKRKPTFDVVVDGLNVANRYKDRSRQSETLLAVVLELVGQGLTVLVLGRKHMLSKSWDRHNMKLIQQKAHCFFTENISEDDPFLLYATLHSGNHCRFVSRDLMRDHKACLPDEATRRLFFKWQRGHQLVLQSIIAARLRFEIIASYDTIIQASVDSWHIPYDDTEDRSSYEVPQRWLCLTAKH